MPGTLYIVATPIGNLEDITLRALRVLKEVDLIAAEDTRHTQILLRHFGIRTPLTSYHEHNERAKARQLIERVQEGQSIALVSDAGTPAISDPGFRMVVEAVAAKVAVVPVPGVTALTAVLSAGGLPTDRFIFEGFLPPKQKERRARLQALRDETRTLVFYEAPHRLREALNDMQGILGERQVVLAREVSKTYEEFLRGPISNIIQQIAERAIKGEITLLVRGSEEPPAISQEQLKNEIDLLKGEGMRVKEIAQLLGERHAYSKKEIYRIALTPKRSTTP
jgi:16S rRNA (cytidine1402-2'-O)-methyltransferase